MATLAISFGLQIGISLALSYLFPPPDVTQEGPRLKDRNVMSSAHGTPIPVTFGTDRVPGMVISARPIIEKRHKETNSGKKGGGGKSVVISYTYFLTATVAFGVAGADDVLRIWGDGKLILDRVTDSENTSRVDFDYRFHPGGEDQGTDSTEASYIDEADLPAYRHLTRITIFEMPLADYGNRPPNITAEISYNASISSSYGGTFPGPFSINWPGSLTETTQDPMAVDIRTNSYFGMTTDANGTWRADLTTGVILAKRDGGAAFMTPGYGWDVVFTATDSAGNNTTLEKVNALTMETVATTAFTAENDGRLNVLRAGTAELGYKLFGIQHDALFGNSRIVDLDTMALFKTVDDDAEFPNHDSTVIIPDDARGFDSQRCYIVGSNGSATYVYAHSFTAELGLLGVAFSHDITHHGTFNFPNGGNVVHGWAVDATTGYLHLYNDSSAVIYDPETETVIAEKTSTLSRSTYMYVHGSIYAIASGNQTTCTLRVISTRDLTILNTIDLDSAFFDTGGKGIHDYSVTWESQSRRLICSRHSAGETPSAPDAAVRIFVDKASGSGVPLDDVVAALCTEYNGQPMAGLALTDIDVTDLASDSVDGFTLNEQGTVRDALEQLRAGYLFDCVQSDWVLKFVKRGAAAVATIPEEHIGFVGRDDGTPVVTETRLQEAELPMRINVRYRNQSVDYSPDVEHAKRIINPTPAVRFQEEKTLDLALVFNDGTVPKQLAEKTLFTLWNERRVYSSGMPWKYILLEPTDVVNLGLFGETIQARLANQDIGANLAIEFRAVREQSFTFASTLQTAGSPGFITQTVPNQRATKVIFLDAPLLAAADLNLGATSIAYVAMGSYASGWPGALMYSSANEDTWSERATANVPMAWGLVSAPPTIIEHGDCGDYVNHFQEEEDGGFMDIVVQQRADAFVEATEDEIYEGANAIAVVTDDGVEIIQFQYVEQLDDDSPSLLRLSRLLRNRLGTEDVSGAGSMAVGDELVLLRGAVDTTEEGAIVGSDLPFADVGQPLFFRAVTIGTLIENADSLSFTYTGRDLRPYSPVEVEVVAGSPDGLDIDWERRTRLPAGPLGGSTDAPLYETIEQYEVEIDDGADTVTKVVDDDTTVNFSDAELAALYSGDTTLIGTARVRQVSGTGLKSPWTECSFEVTP